MLANHSACPADRHGLGSEVALLIRAAAVARAYGYEGLFINDDNWNFGKVSRTHAIDTLSVC